jgi:hypothetical protein
MSREKAKEQLARLLQGVDRSDESRQLITELAGQLADPANRTYDRSAAGLVTWAERVSA